MEADFGASPGAFAPIYTYSQSKGLYAGISFDGKVIVTRNRVNERFYGREVTGPQILNGEIPSPPAARPLYDALQRCHVYAKNGGVPKVGGGGNFLLDRPTSHIMHGYPEQHQFPLQQQTQMMEHALDYGNPLDSGNVMPPAANDQHSYAGMSDITSDPGY